MTMTRPGVPNMSAMVRELHPVPCPKCSERQNHLPGGFDPDRDPFGPVFCMACRHQFDRAEYLSGLDRVVREMKIRRHLRSQTPE